MNAHATALVDRINDLCRQVNRDVETLTRDIAGSCPDGDMSHPHVGYLSVAAKMLAIAAQEIGQDGLYVPAEQAGEIDHRLAQFAAA